MESTSLIWAIPSFSEMREGVPPLVNISSKNGNLLEEKKLFEEALTINPNNQEMNHGYGVLLLKLNQHVKGLGYIRKGTGFIRFSSESYKII